MGTPIAKPESQHGARPASSGTSGRTTEKRGLRGVFARLAASDDDLAADELLIRSQGAGCCPVSDALDRSKVKLRGVLRSVTLQPRRGTPALEAELFDGSGTVMLVWLGRRRITGISCGRRIVVEGRISALDGRRVIYNPAYELQPEGVDEPS
jgi:hypothetical protein